MARLPDNVDRIDLGGAYRYVAYDATGKAHRIARDPSGCWRVQGFGYGRTLADIGLLVGRSN